MSADADMMLHALAQGMLLERITVLALEWHAKTITDERFAKRVYEMLYESDKAMRLGPQPGAEQ